MDSRRKDHFTVPDVLITPDKIAANGITVDAIAANAIMTTKTNVCAIGAEKLRSDEEQALHQAREKEHEHMLRLNNVPVRIDDLLIKIKELQ